MIAYNSLFTCYVDRRSSDRMVSSFGTWKRGQQTRLSLDLPPGNEDSRHGCLCTWCMEKRAAYRVVSASGI
jgi:hypothetical protein